MLVFVALGDVPPNCLEGNRFPMPSGLRELLAGALLHVERRLGTAAFPPIDDTWNARLDTVDSVLDDRRGHMEAWQLAERRSSMIGDLLEDGTLSGELLVLRHARAIRRQRVSREPPQDP